jgi:DNA-directed RNA polymerase subunit F
MKEEHISKIIDITPENQEDINKIFVGINLDENESKKILDTIKSE